MMVSERWWPKRPSRAVFIFISLWQASPSLHITQTAAQRHPPDCEWDFGFRVCCGHYTDDCRHLCESFLCKSLCSKEITQYLIGPTVLHSSTMMHNTNSFILCTNGIPTLDLTQNYVILNYFQIHSTTTLNGLKTILHSLNFITDFVPL